MRALLPLFVGVACFAGAAACAQPVAVTTTLGLESRYVFRGVQLAEASFQPAVQLGWSGAYLGVWANLPVGDEDFIVTPDWQEIDFVVGWSGAVAGPLSIDIGMTYYAYPNRQSGFFDIYREDGSGGGFNTAEPYIGFALNAPLSPKLYAYHDFMFDTTTLQGALSHSIPLAEKLSADLSGVAGYVFDDAGGTDYLYGHLTANFTYAISDTASIYAGGRFGGSDIAGGSVYSDGVLGLTKPSGLWFGIGLTAKF